MKRPPKLCRHKKRDYAYVTLQGKQVYLGKWGSAEAQAAYDRFLIDWAKAQNQPSLQICVAKENVLLAELVAAYNEEYSARPQHSNADAYAFLQVGQRLCDLFPGYYADDFRVRDLERFRDSWQKAGFMVRGKRKEYSRTYLNKVVGRVKTIFAWGVGKELVSAETADRLKYLPALRKWLSDAPEPSERHSILDEDYKAVRGRISRYYGDILDLLRITGMRPSELCLMRICDIDKKTVRGTWIYTPSHHKTAYRGGNRVIALGKQSQKILAPHLKNRNENEYVFTPCRAMESKWEERREKRKTPLQPSQAQRDKESRAKRLSRYGDKLEPNLIARIVQRACKQALKDGKIKRAWTPYELRHTAITKIRAKYGAEAAQHFAGHSNLDTQKFYDHSALMTAVDLARKNG